MKLPIGCLVASLTIVVGCSASEPTNGTPAASETPLRAESCRQEVDASDPNGTAYLLCPGVAGYSLIVRSVDAGRQSIEVVDPGKRTFPLDYQEFVTRHMADLGEQAQWWVEQREGQPVPVALSVRVNAHEGDDPAEVTRTYIALAKITSGQICVVDRIVDDSGAADRLRQAIDGVTSRPCVAALPPLAAADEGVR